MAEVEYSPDHKNPNVAMASQSSNWLLHRLYMYI